MAVRFGSVRQIKTFTGSVNASIQLVAGTSGRFGSLNRINSFIESNQFVGSNRSIELNERIELNEMNEKREFWQRPGPRKIVEKK